MTKKEHIEKNIGVTLDFVRQVIEQPELIETIPQGAELDFIDKDWPAKKVAKTGKRKVARYKVQHIFEPV